MIPRRKGKTRVDPDWPEAAGTCDRCGVRSNLADLIYQSQWMGRRLTNLKIRVCERCHDQPAAFLVPPRTGPDPEPVLNIRPEFMDVAKNYRVTEDGSNRITEDGQLIVLDGTSA